MGNSSANLYSCAILCLEPTDVLCLLNVILVSRNISVAVVATMIKNYEYFGAKTWEVS